MTERAPLPIFNPIPESVKLEVVKYLEEKVRIATGRVNSLRNKTDQAKSVGASVNNKTRTDVYSSPEVLKELEDAEKVVLKLNEDLFAILTREPDTLAKYVTELEELKKPLN